MITCRTLSKPNPRLAGSQVAFVSLRELSPTQPLWALPFVVLISHPKLEHQNLSPLAGKLSSNTTGLTVTVETGDVSPHISNTSYYLLTYLFTVCLCEFMCTTCVHMPMENI